MKKIILPLVALTTLALGSCNMANDDDYKNLATDMCDCVNKNTKGLSPEMQDIFKNYANDPNMMQTKMQEYTMNNMEAAMKDMEKMEKIGTDIEACAKDLEKKYDNLYTADNEKEVEKKMIEILKKEKGCELTYALFQIASREGK